MPPRPGRRLPHRSRAPDLADLLRRSSRGDEAAFAALYDATSRRLFGLVLRVVRDHAMSEEVTQEVYLDVWRQSARFDAQRGSALSWLMTIAHRTAVDRVRSSEASRRRDDAHAAASHDVEFDATAEAAQATLEAQRVRRALATLTDAQRSAVELAYLGGYTHTEVARPPRPPARHRQDPDPGRPHSAPGHDGSSGMSPDLHHLSGAYAVDALDEGERALFEQHLAGCADCRAEVAELSATAHSLSALTEETPPPSLRAAVLSGISQVRPLPPLGEDDTRMPSADARASSRHPNLQPTTGAAQEHAGRRPRRRPSSRSAAGRPHGSPQPRRRRSSRSEDWRGARGRTRPTPHRSPRSSLPRTRCA